MTDDQYKGLGIDASDRPEGADHTHVLADLQLDSAGLVELAQRLGYAGVPGMGNFQNDTVAVNDSVNTGFPLYVDFVLPSNLVKLAALRLSFKVRAFRSYVNTSVTGDTGAGTSHAHTNPNTSTDAVGESGHGHSHAHNVPFLGGQTGTGNFVDLGGSGANVIGSTAATNRSFVTDAQNPASSGHSHSHLHSQGNTGNEAAHTHPLTAAITFQIQESTLPAGIRISIDNSPTDGSAGDLTAGLGGPWAANVVELDLTTLINPTPGYHTIWLTSTQLGRIMAYLRATSIVNPLSP